MFEALAAIGVTDETIDRIKRLYCDTIQVQVEGYSETCTFSSTNGEKQGCPMSPTLWALTLDFLLRNTPRDPSCNIVMYADDILITAASKNNLQQCITNLAASLQHAGLIINPAKSHIMHINPMMNPTLDSLNGHCSRIAK